ncbi:unnamed protein product, partial [Hapterophycus canaliculatus]
LSVERILVWPRLCRMIVHPVVGGAVAALLTYMAVCITWVFFRADSLAQAVEITYQLGNFRSLNLSHTLSSFKGLAKILVLAMFFREAFFFLKLEQTKFFHSRLFDNSRVVFLATIIVLTILFRGPGQTFVYFQF